ncbi:MAG: N-acetyl sugar amidotransferase [Cylindrospermopsis raciborskii KL1]|uniref:N-acetyl sugar amidotransferase n=1 Tax=Cylindrospermopsis raciborskii TaxID=77022 RepID=UPI001A34D56B|nr:N-acetyl sugar amidotransferase [Cylindrospermopsis raciborskii]MBG0744686.1 N-acetyl sugar amidotransferase [Cylindrospermopsis raciborskii KL1]
MKTEKPYQRCNRCVMDTSALDITFDVNGVCNYCTEFLERSAHLINEDPVAKKARLDELVLRVKRSGHGKPYDCVVGVSGGVDSSWTLVQVVKLGLRPLAVHMDNGWNSELAQNNIANLVRGLGVDLYTHVIDWEEYRNLMQAFFDANVIDVELLYDNAMLAVNYQQASRYNIKFILAGTNQATEGMRMPKEWNWFKYDKRNIQALGRSVGTRLNTFPSIGTLGYIYYEFLRKIKWTSFLDFVPYNKFEALDNLERDFGYKRYPFKHYESIFTRFYQGYLLPRKFNVDKRKLHLGTLVASGQMTRDEALIGLEGIPYPSLAALEEDVEYFLKKMRWNGEQLNNYLIQPEIPHNYYPTEKPLWDFLTKVYKTFKIR